MAMATIGGTEPLNIIINVNTLMSYFVMNLDIKPGFLVLGIFSSSSSGRGWP
jgi:hypothetical protein